MVTDAFGIGINISNIIRVVQREALNLDNLDILKQRFGCTGRDLSIQDICILYYKESYTRDRNKTERDHSGVYGTQLQSASQNKLQGTRSSRRYNKEQRPKKRSQQTMCTEMDIGL